MEPADPTSSELGPRALLVDVLEWFQDDGLRASLSRRHWRRFAPRARIAVDAALRLCERSGATATFFVCGGLAEREPDLLRAIVAGGHELACSGLELQDSCDATGSGGDAALARLDRARAAIEAVGGGAVAGFGAPWPSPAGAWWHAALAERGYAYDASAAGAARPAAAPGSLRIVASVPWRATKAGAEAIRVRSYEFDEARPRLTGLPRRVLRAHHAGLDDAAARFAGVLAGGAFAPVRTVLGLALRPAPARPAPPPASAVSAAPPAAPAATGPRTRVAVVVPMMNEAEGVPSLIPALDELAERLRARCELEFVFVDDGSTDRTWSVLQELVGARSDVRLERHARNAGVAAAIRTGLRAARADVVCSIDSDLSYDPLELERMLPLLDGADVVTASPYHPRGGVRNVPGWRLLLSRVLSRCYRFLLRSELHTWTSCFRLYRRAAVVDLPLDHGGFLGTAELLVRVLRRGGRVREHPCVLEARLFGASKMKVLRTIRGHLGLLVRTAAGRVR
jgi:hypothetical protein